jgi:hypothetical protein
LFDIIDVVGVGHGFGWKGMFWEISGCTAVGSDYFLMGCHDFFLSFFLTEIKMSNYRKRKFGFGEQGRFVK